MPEEALRRLRVLVVDDDPLQLRAILRRFHDHQSVEVSTVDNALDALLTIGASKPDVVIVDALMPGTNGLEVCRRIRTDPALREMMVVLASATMTEELMAAAEAAGANRAVGKPVDVLALAGAVVGQPLRERWRALGEKLWKRSPAGFWNLVAMLATSEGDEDDEVARDIDDVYPFH